MAKHWAARFASTCSACDNPVKPGDMVVKIKDVRCLKRRKYFIVLCKGKSEAWVHKACYKAMIEVWHLNHPKPETL